MYKKPIPTDKKNKYVIVFDSEGLGSVNLN